MGLRHHPLDKMVKESVDRVIEVGTANADTQDVILAGFDWMVDKRTPEPSMFTKFKGREASGFTGGAAIIYIAQLLGLLPAGG